MIEEPTELTEVQPLPYPDRLQGPADVPNYIMRLAEAVELKLVMTFENSSDRSTRVSSPMEGMFAWMKDTNTFVAYDGNGWLQIYPAVGTQILTGTTVPGSGLGDDGDVYFRYS